MMPASRRTALGALGCAFVCAVLFGGAARGLARISRLLALLEGRETPRAASARARRSRASWRRKRLGTNNAAVLVRIAKEYWDLIDETKPPREAERLGETALAYAKRAVSLEPSSAKAHLCLAVCYGKLTDFADASEPGGIRARDEGGGGQVPGAGPHGRLRVSRARAVDTRGGESEPVRNGSRRSVTAGCRMEGTKRRRRITKAAEIAPQRIVHHNELARVYVALGKNDLARKEWQTVLDLPAANKADEAAKQEAKEALRRQ